MSEIEETLNKRHETHGSFKDVSHVNMNLLNSIQGFIVNTNTQSVAIHMILHKISRIMAGNSNFIDHWKDIEGYAALIRKELENG